MPDANVPSFQPWDYEVPPSNRPGPSYDPLYVLACEVAGLALEWYRFLRRRLGR